MRERSFERVYYFVGDNDFLKESTLREFVAAVNGSSVASLGPDILRGAEASAEALDTALNTPPLFAESRVVVLRDVQGLRKEPRELLRRYLAHPAADTVLVLLSPAGEKPDRSLIDASSTVEFESLAPDRIPRWIAHHASTVTRAEITPDAAELLHTAVGDDLPQLAAELDKLASFTGGSVITAEAVSAVVGIRREESLGSLLDAVAARDAARGLDLAGRILAQPKTTLVSVIMALATQTVAMAWGRAALDGGLSPRALEREYFTLLRECKVYPGRPWGEAVTGWSRFVPGWSSRALDEALRRILAADAAAKETRVTSDQQVLTTLVLTLCAADRRAAA
ncbi:MAG TPA: DNA polymerase III subunit delta [Gemmatimonadaceae bacterium]|nr:DNA polymerase III subunit delta [Gemmatimonadaceae bacterium]